MAKNVCQMWSCGLLISIQLKYHQRGQGQQPQRGKKEDDEQSNNIVEGLLEIVNMITDNPGLKSDLQEYFENSKREEKEDKRRINSESRCFVL